MTAWKLYKCVCMTTNQSLNLILTQTSTLPLNSTQYGNSEHSTKYSHMSYVSREIHTRQCSCIVFTTFRCHCPLPFQPKISDGGHHMAKEVIMPLPGSPIPWRQTLPHHKTKLHSVKSCAHSAHANVVQKNRLEFRGCGMSMRHRTIKDRKNLGCFINCRPQATRCGWNSNVDSAILFTPQRPNLHVLVVSHTDV